MQYLKSFLEYAERGKVALMHMEYGAKKKAKDAFVESVAKALQAKGYAVHTNIGSSEYRVDIGIIDPESPDRYLLGLLCDGYNYVASHTAHDRDVTTPAVLSLLGWRTYNIWSVEWWDTPEHVLNGIIRENERVKAKESAEENINNLVDDDIEDSGQTQVVTKKTLLYLTLMRRSILQAIYQFALLILQCSRRATIQTPL